MENKREHIIQCAISQFNKYGIQAAAISSIAEAAGISKGTLYYYFKSKEELVDSAFEYVKSNALSFLLPRVDYEAEPETVIKQLVRSSFAWPLERPGEMEFLDKYINLHFYDKNTFGLFSFKLFEDKESGRRMRQAVKEDCPLDLLNYLIGHIITIFNKYVIIYPDYYKNERFLDCIAQMIWDFVAR
ncbi:MAG: TetR/AcrR family transcriptional regulator [Clostridiales bacterium]|jgi:AcrR family transcriptional regulator|nr:TetR/AcrR family transcriptional regulator [Eubacteriales bacterium]MDH7566719.1 TetR/AcrR family transcriptional regulator [Clostridiales bacterium]